MKFYPDDHNNVVKEINGVRFRTSTWIKGHRTLEAYDQVNVVFAITTGQASTSIMVNTEEINSLIEMLQLTLNLIKSAEIELLAIDSKKEAA